jgi:hypothetical protein
MAAVALAVGLALAIVINSFAGSSGPDGEELRRAADRPPSDVAELRLSPPADRARAVKHKHRRRHARAAASAPVRSAPARPTTALSYTASQQPPALKQTARPAPKPTARPAPKPRPGGGGAGQPFDDSG